MKLLEERSDTRVCAVGWVNYLLTPRCRVLLEQLTGLQLVKKFPAFHGTRRFITTLTSVRHLSLSWASPIQSTYPHPTSWRSILILSSHLYLGLSSDNDRLHSLNFRTQHNSYVVDFNSPASASRCSYMQQYLFTATMTIVTNLSLWETYWSRVWIRKTN